MFFLYKRQAIFYLLLLKTKFTVHHSQPTFHVEFPTNTKIKLTKLYKNILTSIHTYTDTYKHIFPI